MRKYICSAVMLLSALVAAADDSGDQDVMRVEPIGCRIGSSGGIQAFDSSVATVAPAGVSIAVPDTPVDLSLALNRDYEIVCWQKYGEDPRERSVKPLGLFGEGEESVSVEFDKDVGWMYVVAVLEYNPTRTVNTRVSSFGKGRVTISQVKETYLKGDELTLTAQPDEGYAFVRWSDGNVDHTRTLTVNDDVDLVAFIEPKPCRVTFSAGPEAVLDVSGKRVCYDSAYGALPVPTRTGSRFSHWSDDEGRAVSAMTTVNRTDDHALYAEWDSSSYEIAWKIVGGGNGRVDGAGVHVYGSQATLTAVPYEGSAFVGWADGETRNPRRVTVLSNATYVAEFDVATYDVTFTYRDAGGKSVTTAPQTVAYGKAATLPAGYDNWPEHTFKNWSTEEYLKVTRNLSVEAIYDSQTYSVVFVYRNWQGNCVTTMPQNVISGGKASPPDRSVADNWEGHTLKGWQPDYNVIRSDTFCEAIYEINSYAVKFTYRGPDGEVRESVETVKHGGMVQSVPETAAVDSWSGHRFLGWSNEDYLSPITGSLEVFARYEGYCEIDYKDALGTNLVEEIKDPKDWTNLRPVAELNEVEGYTFEKTGYEFSGWKTNETGSAVYGDGARVRIQNGDILALISKWDPIEYKIGFDLNGGTGDIPGDLNMSYDQVKPLPKIPTPPPAGTSSDRAFWTSERDNTNSVCYRWGESVSNLTTKAGERVILYAYWPKISYEVKIDDGHGGTMTIPMEYGAEIGDPGVPVARMGYQFAGWLTNDVAVEEFPITVPVNGITLKADWTANAYTVVFHGNGETSGAIDRQTFVYDKWQALTANGFARTGYTFAGWATNVTGSAVYSDRQSVRSLASDEGAVVDLYAVWTANAYTVEFCGTDGTYETSGTMDPQAFTYDAAKALTLNSFTRDRYVFAGWTNDERRVFADGEAVSNLTVAAGGTVTLWATWSDAPSYAVRFNPNGGEGEPYSQGILCGQATALMPNRFARTGYAFANWTNATGTAYADGVKVTDLAAEGATNDLYAVWTPNRYWVKFAPNDGSGTMKDQQFDYDVAQALTSNTYVRAGWMFDGWTNEMGKVFADGAKVKNLATTEGATVTLYAKWQESIDPLNLALGLSADCGVEVSVEGAWKISGEAEAKSGLVRTSASPDGTLRVTVPPGGKLYFEFDVDNMGGSMTVKFNGDVLDQFSTQAKTTYGPEGLESGGVFEFSGTPNDGTTWTLKNFKWTAK